MKVVVNESPTCTSKALYTNYSYCIAIQDK